MGSTFNEIIKESKKIFKENKVFKPAASRKDSKRELHNLQVFTLGHLSFFKESYIQ